MEIQFSYSRILTTAQKWSVTGTFIPENIRSWEWNAFPKTFVPRNFRSLELSFPNTDYQAYTVHNFLMRYCYAVGNYGIIVCHLSVTDVLLGKTFCYNN